MASLVNARRLGWRIAASLMVLAAVTALCYRLAPVNAATAGFAYLVAILGIATAWRLAAAIVAAVAATLCFNFFFLPPIGQFTIADPQNWAALSAFLVTALVASHLSERAKRRTLEALRRQRETERLYAFSRAILLADLQYPLARQAAQQIASIFDCSGVALYDATSGEVFHGGAEELSGVDGKLKEAVARGATEEAGAALTILPIILGGRPFGSLAVTGLSLSDGALRAMLNLVAIALERVRAQEAASRATAARQGEEFKSTLLDAIAHELKTPLTSIKAASTSILSDRALPLQLRELETIIDEEADRMNRLVTEAVRMSQIDAGRLRLERVPLDVGPLVDGVAAQFASRAEGRKLNVSAAPRIPRIWADPELVSLALRQLIDNALKYSYPGTPVDIAIGEEHGRVLIQVRDQGPGIPEHERARIFQKFHRFSGPASHVPGTGLGLYVAREIVRTHGGDVSIEDTIGPGCVFRISLPAESEHQRP